MIIAWHLRVSLISQGKKLNDGWSVNQQWFVCSATASCRFQNYSIHTLPLCFNFKHMFSLPVTLLAKLPAELLDQHHAIVHLPQLPSKPLSQQLRPHTKSWLADETLRSLTLYSLPTQLGRLLEEEPKFARNVQLQRNRYRSSPLIQQRFRHASLAKISSLHANLQQVKRVRQHRTNCTWSGNWCIEGLNWSLEEHSSTQCKQAQAESLWKPQRKSWSAKARSSACCHLWKQGGVASNENKRKNIWKYPRKGIQLVIDASNYILKYASTSIYEFEEYPQESHKSSYWPDPWPWKPTRSSRMGS